MEIELSAIICAHNPVQDYLRRVLESLKAQTLPKEQWELVLIDNASNEPLAGKWEMSWHSNARIVVEPRQGLTPSRLRGIRESKGEIVVFVDDDNVLDSNYLYHVARIASEYSIMGVWGGQIVAESETGIPSEMSAFAGYLTIAPLEQNFWSNTPECVHSLPFGAGICLRKKVAEAYARLLESDPRRMSLGRQGKTLGGCDDFDMAYTGLDLGYGMGRFKELKVTHLIPQQRLTWEYLEKAVVGGDSSTLVLKYLRGWPIQRYIPRRDRVKFWMDYWVSTPGYRRLMLAKERGRRLGLELVAEMERTASATK